MGFKEALYYKKLANKKVHCLLCPHSCFINNGESGKCVVRQNVDGRLKSMFYAKPHIIKYKKIEESGLFHVFPGLQCLVMGFVGDNLIEKNKDIQIEESIVKQPKLSQTVNEILNEVKKTNTNIIGVGFAEPIVSYEYIKDLFQAQNTKKDLKKFIVTKSYINYEPLKELSKLLNAVCIEINSIKEDFYRNNYGVDLSAILKSIKELKESKVWIEIRMDLISGLNDDIYELRKFISWIMNNLGADTPIHFRYDEKNKETAEKIKKIAMDVGMNYVYIDNGELDDRTTFCPNCKNNLIIRNSRIENRLLDGKCACGQRISGLWE